MLQWLIRTKIWHTTWSKLIASLFGSTWVLDIKYCCSNRPGPSLDPMTLKMCRIPSCILVPWNQVALWRLLASTYSLKLIFLVHRIITSNRPRRVSNCFFFFPFSKFLSLHLEALKRPKGESAGEQTEGGSRMACCFPKAQFSSPTLFPWGRSPTLPTLPTHIQNPPISFFIFSNFLWLCSNIDIKRLWAPELELGWKAPSHTAQGRSAFNLKEILQGPFTMAIY